METLNFYSWFDNWVYMDIKLRKRNLMLMGAKYIDTNNVDLITDGFKFPTKSRSLRYQTGGRIRKKLSIDHSSNVDWKDIFYKKIG